MNDITRTSKDRVVALAEHITRQIFDIGVEHGRRPGRISYKVRLSGAEYDAGGLNEAAMRKYVTEAIQAFEGGTAPEPDPEWRCFHCEEVFTDRAAALEHFGPHQGCDSACQIDIAEYRRMEKCCDSHHAEDTELHRALHAKDAEMQTKARQAEETGYARGLEDAKKHPETLGLTRAAPPPGLEVPILRNYLGNLFAAVQRFGPIDADITFAMGEAAQALGPPYSTATKEV